LAGAQGADGGFGNSFATTWAMQAIAALAEDPDDWRKNGQSPQSFLAAKRRPTAVWKRTMLIRITESGPRPTLCRPCRKKLGSR